MSYIKTDLNDAVGTSFHDVVIEMRFDDLIKKLGQPHVSYASGDKVQYEWCFKGPADRPVTVYDWKEYGNPRPSEWHVGGWDKWDTVDFKTWFDGL
jgi:hypothetical protein